jgi:hypothetical protein
MAKPSTLPTQATDHAAGQAQTHLPTSLPPDHTDPTGAASSAVVPSLPHQATDAVVEHVALLGAADHLPDFFPLAG